MTKWEVVFVWQLRYFLASAALPVIGGIRAATRSARSLWLG